MVERAELERVYLLDESSPSTAHLEQKLIQYNVQAQLFEDLDSGLAEIRKVPPDLLMLDPSKVGSGDMEVIQFLKSVDELKSVPFLICSDRMPEEGIIRSLDFGGDDFLPKPVKIGEAVSRIRGLLRRRKMSVLSTSEKNSYVGMIRINLMTNINLMNHEIQCDGKEIKLTMTEATILKELARNPGHVISRQKLMQSVWPVNRIVEDQNLDVHISSIRKKIEENPRRPEIVVTVRGVGFKMNLR
jgi:DNA-binding response OmpR family regulator